MGADEPANTKPRSMFTITRHLTLYVRRSIDPLSIVGPSTYFATIHAGHHPSAQLHPRIAIHEMAA